jgi:hypothetical protein
LMSAAGVWKSGGREKARRVRRKQVICRCINRCKGPREAIHAELERGSKLTAFRAL